MKNMIKLLLILTLSTSLYANITNLSSQELTEISIDAKQLLNKKDFKGALEKYKIIEKNLTNKISLKENEKMKGMLLSIRASTQMEMVSTYISLKDITTANLKVDEAFKSINEIDNKNIKEQLYSLRGTIKYLNKEYAKAAENIENGLKLSDYYTTGKISIDTIENRQKTQEITQLIAIMLESNKLAKDKKKVNETYDLLYKVLDEVYNQGVIKIKSFSGDSAANKETILKELESNMKREMKGIKDGQAEYNKQFK